MTGTLWRTPALRIKRLAVAAGTRLRAHGHDMPHMCFLSRGAFQERDNGGTRRVSPGTLRSSPAGDEHHLVFEVDSTCLLILVEGEAGLLAAHGSDGATAVQVDRTTDDPRVRPER